MTQDTDMTEGRLDAISGWFEGKAEHSSLDDLSVIPEWEAVRDLIAEVRRLRHYRSLPEGMVWQDYHSPDEVVEIREQYEAEVRRLREEREHVRAIAADDFGEHPTATSRAEGCSCDACTKFPPDFQ